MSKPETFSARRKLVQSAKGMMILPLTPAEAQELLDTAKSRAHLLRKRREYMEALARDLGGEMNWAGWMSAEDTTARHAAGMMGAKLKSIARGVRGGADYTHEEAAGFLHYLDWMSRQDDSLFDMEKEMWRVKNEE
jgi:hypothetical protein